MTFPDIAYQCDQMLTPDSRCKNMPTYQIHLRHEFAEQKTGLCEPGVILLCNEHVSNLSKTVYDKQSVVRWLGHLDSVKCSFCGRGLTHPTQIGEVKPL